jgi:hypothetical protein
MLLFLFFDLLHTVETHKYFSTLASWCFLKDILLTNVFGIRKNIACKYMLAQKLQLR